MSKHTLGKWKVRSSGEVGTEHKLVASIYPLDSEDAKTKKANARLIASAPELLERLYVTNRALKKILEPILQSGMEGSGMTIASIMRYNEQAITKAKRGK